MSKIGKIKHSEYYYVAEDMLEKACKTGTVLEHSLMVIRRYFDDDYVRKLFNAHNCESSERLAGYYIQLKYRSVTLSTGDYAALLWDLSAMSEYIGYLKALIAIAEERRELMSHLPEAEAEEEKKLRSEIVS